MKFESLVIGSSLLLAGLETRGSAQIVLGGQPGEAVYYGQVAPAPPPPPQLPQMQDLVRLMALNGSYLGVGVRDIDAERKRVLNLKEERGAEVTSVEEDSPAAKAGLKTGDVVLEYAGQQVESMEQFIRMVRETPAGREVKLSVLRAGSAVSLTARPESGRNRVERTIRVLPIRPQGPGTAIPGWAVDSPRSIMYWHNGSLGVEAEALDNQLADFFGVREGVLVRSVTKGTPADKAGVKAGDVIVKVDETKVSSPREVTNAVRTAKTKTISLGLIREKKEHVVKVTFEDEGPAPVGIRGRSVQNKLHEN
ncbi:PDZ domain-containing protein [Bryobacter aggregatus]|uniref:PDZ domain-containing protein n=1 Tax=Bryobacter aggregatus TaxID=360054 RepID=UPI0004E252E3|nr:PDZ domain-containing protein [Bryobacter aggregatus]